MARLRFPSNPSNSDRHTDNNKTYEYLASKNRWKVVGAQAVSASREAELAADLATATADIAALQEDGGGGGGTTAYANTAQLPLTGLEAGQMAFDEAGNRLYISNGSGWYKITLINTDPTITANAVSVKLGSSGNTVLVGYTYNEPEGTPTTITIANSGIANTSQGNVVHYSANQTLEINNFSAEGDEWTANVVLTVSDGENTGIDSFTISVVYAPDPSGVLFTSTGSNSFTIPDGVEQFSAVAVGGGGGGMSRNGSGGGGGGGGALAYVNNVACTPGEVWTVQVGVGGTRALNTTAGAGGDSWIAKPDTTKVVHAGGGSGGANQFGATNAGGTVIIGTGGAGGAGRTAGGTTDAGAGGGAGGYSGAGGEGGYQNAAPPATPAGGGGGGGGPGGSADSAGGGGGVGLYGEGASGAAGTYGGGNGGGGGGGSGGAAGTNGDNPQGDGGLYGGGGGGAENNGEHGVGAQGAVRIIWGDVREFPTTDVGDSAAMVDGIAETEV